jgi:hypothetical protein
MPSIAPGWILRWLVPSLALTAWLAALLIWTGRWQALADEPQTVEGLVAQFTTDIAGEDGDGNGIRDDVDAWMAGQFPGADPMASAVRQLATDYQGVLTTTAAAEASLANLVRLAESVGCVHHVAGLDANEVITQLKAVVLDSDIRVRAWLKAEERWQASGMAGMASSSATNCRFPVSSPATP